VVRQKGARSNLDRITDEGVAFAFAHAATVSWAKTEAKPMNRVCVDRTKQFEAVSASLQLGSQLKRWTLGPASSAFVRMPVDLIDRHSYGIAMGLLALEDANGLEIKTFHSMQTFGELGKGTYCWPVKRKKAS